MNVCRRSFLSGSAVTALAAAGGCCTGGAPRRGDRVAAPWLEADVVVAGGGPAGVCAAVSAARLGAKTILVERFGCLGGNLTLGHVSPILGKVCPGTMADEVRRLLNANHLDAPKVMTRNGPEEHIDHEEAKGILRATAPRSTSTTRRRRASLRGSAPTPASRCSSARP